MGAKRPEPHSPDPRSAPRESRHLDASGPSPLMGGAPTVKPDESTMTSCRSSSACDFPLAYVCLFSHRSCNGGFSLFFKLLFNHHSLVCNLTCNTILR